MINHSDSIKALQDTTGRHEQTLTSLQQFADDQKQWNIATQNTLNEMTRQLQSISNHLGISATTSVGGEVTGDSTVIKGKPKIRSDSDEVFPFAPKPVQVELPLFTGKDPEE
ncbi:hypothetical protein HRI_001659800 [Hibiscus trionum]|uniref:Uncharacterized protein n=1 Tax=Hibiscus trionum TaxID=183268 RepID=A0A9W7HLB2_HIBTR|nr:hypothetical protein HRI_001659800 [Hibiscus trionum]